ncbi:MAG TPA: hypothetical protein VF629_11065 [Hymenobacter sp.]|uniref:hypothetical protein n=1 Tax=Hymenobacter sp. TaxID=1898978 RepID=UPI002ED8B1DA
MSSPWPRATGAKLPNSGAKGAAGRRVGTLAKTFLLVMACGLLFGVGLARLSQYFGANSGSPVPEASGAPATAALDSMEHEAAVPISQLPITGSQYRVAVEKAYLFANPQHSAPLKRFLQRGDVFYADGDSNGFVRTTFVQLNGAQGNGWLRQRELHKIAASPPPKAVPATAPVAPAALAAATSTRRTAKPVLYRSRAAQSAARQPARTRVGAWLQRTREKVLPRRKASTEAKRNKKKAPPCKCAVLPIGPSALAAQA